MSTYTGHDYDGPFPFPQPVDEVWAALTDAPEEEPSAAPSPEEATSYVRDAAEHLSRALLGYNPGDWADAVRLLRDLRKATGVLQALDANVTRWLYLHGEHGIHLQVEGVPGHVSITRGRDKERWETEAVVKDYVGARIEENDGEMPDPLQVAEWVMEVLPASPSVSCKRTALRKAGLDPQDYSRSEPGSIRVDLPREALT